MGCVSSSAAAVDQDGSGSQPARPPAGGAQGLHGLQLLKSRADAYAVVPSTGSVSENKAGYSGHTAPSSSAAGLEAAFGIELAKVRRLLHELLLAWLLPTRTHKSNVRACRRPHPPQVIAEAMAGAKAKDAWSILYKCSELVCQVFGLCTCRCGRAGPLV
jgi:hypothetical protein